MFTVLVISDIVLKSELREQMHLRRKRDVHKISYCAVRSREILEVEGRAGERVKMERRGRGVAAGHSDCFSGKGFQRDHAWYVGHNRPGLASNHFTSTAVQ